MRISVVSDVLTDTYDGYAMDSEFVRNYISGMDDSTIVPGVSAWDNVIVTKEADQLTVTADLATMTIVEDNDPSGNGGQLVCSDWIRDYITGADAYWLVPGALVADKITFA